MKVSAFNVYYRHGSDQPHTWADSLRYKCSRQGLEWVRPLLCQRELSQTRRGGIGGGGACVGFTNGYGRRSLLAATGTLN